PGERLLCLSTGGLELMPGLLDLAARALDPGCDPLEGRSGGVAFGEQFEPGLRRTAAAADHECGLDVPVRGDTRAGEDGPNAGRGLEHVVDGVGGGRLRLRDDDLDAPEVL